MKYGGQGGWRAIKRISRDANIADGVAPYSYRARYGQSGRANGDAGPSRGPKWHALLLEMRSLAAKGRDFNSNCLTKNEREEIGSVARELDRLVEGALAAKPGFWGTLFFGDDGWVSRHQPAIQGVLDRFTPLFTRLVELEQRRAKDFRNSNARINKFSASIERRYLVSVRSNVSKSEDQALQAYDALLAHLNKVGSTDEAGRCLPWEVFQQQRKTLLVTLAKHAQLIADLYGRYSGDAAPTVQWDKRQGKIVIGDFSVNVTLK